MASVAGMTPALHPEISHLQFVLGTWRGTGEGRYPTIQSFRYREEVTFTHNGKPFIAYAQKTKGEDGEPLHAETGYLRPVGLDQVELIIAQPTGVTEIHVGSVADGTLALAAREVGVSPTAKSVTAVRRTLRFEGPMLRYRLEMAAVGQPLQFHLEAELERVAE